MEVFLAFLMPVAYRRPPRPFPQDPSELIHRPSLVPGLDYELAPNVKKVAYGTVITTNSFGMRGKEPSLNETGSLFRIAALGDSFTFGLGVADDRAYPSVLEKLLNESELGRAYHYDVLNFGVAAYSTRDEAVVLRSKGLVWHPDLVIIGYVLNDPETDPEQPLQSDYRKPVWWQYSNVARLIMMAKNEWDMWRLGGGNYFKYLHSRQGLKWLSVVAAFSEIREMTESRHIKVLVTIFPMIPNNGQWTGYRYEEIHTQVADAATKSGFHVLDLYPVFATHDPKELRLSPLDAHPNSLAHELAARAIEEKLLSENLAAR